MTVYLCILTAAFMWPLWQLAMHALASGLHSHIVLVPLVSAYLLRGRRRMWPTDTRSPLVAASLAMMGAAVLVTGLVSRARVSHNDYLAMMAGAYVMLLVAGGFLAKGAVGMRAAGFPLGFLVFLVPLPDAVVHALEQASMHASADAAALYFSVAGTALVRQGTLFELPGITLQVAQECSGIRSSWVLFITSVLAANMFLKTGWRRLLLVAFVIPLGVLRNGFRVFVLGTLSVRVGPHILDSPIHHHGGPLFFALSLGPLFVLLWWLRRSEQRNSQERPPRNGWLLALRPQRNSSTS